MRQRMRHQATWLLARAHLRAHSIVQQEFAAAGSKPYTYRLLAALEAYGATSQADLGRRTDIDRSDVVAVLNDLVDRTFALRQPDPGDGRRNIVLITDQGRKELSRLDRVVTGIQSQVLAPLSQSERATLVALLTKLSPDDS